MSTPRPWPKAILFDLDDTLWPIAPAILQAETTLFAWLRAWAEEISGETRVAAACWLTRVVREEPAWLLPAMTFARTCGDESKSWVVSSNILLRATLAEGLGLRGPAGYAVPRRDAGETRGASTYGLGFSYWLRLPHSCVPWISGGVLRGYRGYERRRREKGRGSSRRGEDASAEKELIFELR